MLPFRHFYRKNTSMLSNTFPQSSNSKSKGSPKTKKNLRILTRNKLKIWRKVQFYTIMNWKGNFLKWIKNSLKWQNAIKNVRKCLDQKNKPTKIKELRQNKNFKQCSKIWIAFKARTKKVKPKRKGCKNKFLWWKSNRKKISLWWNKRMITWQNKMKISKEGMKI
jgi:hypothetical protein